MPGLIDFPALIRSYVERLDAADATLRAANEARRAILKQARADNLNPRALKEVIAERRRDDETRDDIATYRAALNQSFEETPLGQAADMVDA
jgi:hypothetical protein